MTFVFNMPEVGEGVVEAEVLEWKVAVGDFVEVDAPLCEITTDKATIEISSPKSGQVTQLHAEPGTFVKVNTPLVDLELSAEGAPAPAAAAPASAAAAAPAPAAAAAPAAPSAESAPLPAPAVTPPRPAPSANRATPPGETRAAPAVRRRARELGLDLHAVTGSGPGGRITQADLDAAQAQPAPLPIAPPAMPQVAASVEDQRIKIIGIRRKIAERMVAAKQTAPHFTYVEEIDCTRLVEMRQRLKGRAAERGVKLTYMPFFAKACSVVFREFPNVNAVMDEAASELVVRGEHHIGFACDTPNGLMVPVVRNVERKSILHLAAEMQDLFERTRAGRATMDELSGGTFTVTSVGSIGGVMATPILNVPEVAILGVNQIRKRPVVVDGQIVVRDMTYLSPSFDHRIVDGAVAARFVRALKDVLENPEALVLELA